MEDIYITKVVKTGTSLGVVIPANLLRANNWKRGDSLVFCCSGTDQLILKRLTDKEVREIKEAKPIILL